MTKKTILFIILVPFLSASLPAKRIGARVMVNLLSGISVGGELLAIDDEKITLSTRGNPNPRIFIMSQVASVHLLRAAAVRKGASLAGAITGFALGIAAGMVAGHDPEAEPDMFGFKGNFAPMWTAPVGMILGAFIASTLTDGPGIKTDRLFLFQDQGLEIRAAAIKELKAMTRKPN